MSFVLIRTIFWSCKKLSEKKNVGKDRNNMLMIFIKLEKLIIIPYCLKRH